MSPGTVTVAPRARQAWMDDRLLELTAKEFDLLAYLVARPGEVFSRDQLLRTVWQSTSEWQQPATVTEHIRRLRAKIEIEPRRPHILRTVRGSGYRLDIAAEPPVGTDPNTCAEAETTTCLLRGLLRITSADEGARLLHTTIRQLGGRLVTTIPAGAEASAIDVSLGQGPPLFVSPGRSVDAATLHQIVADITDDAQHAIDLIAAPPSDIRGIASRALRYDRRGTD